jgi:type VI secretion system secreted protein VgrG
MAEPITQNGRLMKVKTPLDFDMLLLESFSGWEGISRPFSIEVNLLADVVFGNHRKLEVDQLIGKPMSIELELSGDKKRFLNGIVKSFTKDSQDDRFAHYRAELVPWFSLLQLKSDCRIFQDLSVPKIVERVIEELGFKEHFRADLSGSYTKWDYCVQYRETDFNFISRLLEEEGISYYYEHKDDGTHTMVLVDSLESHKECPEEHSFRFDPVVGFGDSGDTVRTWQSRQELLSASWTLRDHHFEMPRNTLEVTEVSTFADDANKSFDLFDYPGGYVQKFNKPESRLDQVRTEGEAIARLRMEQEETRHIVHEGSSKCRAFSSGYQFTLAGGAQAPSGDYLLVTVHHSAVQHPAYLTHSTVGGAAYSNTFSCIPAATLFCPARITPKPVLAGPQTARVIDKNPEPKEEIFPDKYGRVLVRFHWDREAKYACWIRVAQPWASKGWGHQWIPRVGDEVVVTFLEGDPDCPIITGSVYNHDNMPPFKLPDHKTQSGIKTHSSPKGGAENYNMIRFEDKKGSEDLLIHAERTMHNSVEGSQFITVGGDRHITTGGTDKSGENKGDVKEKIFKNHNLHILGDDREKVEGKQSINIVGDSSALFSKTRSVQVTTDDLVVAKTITLQAQQSITLMVGGNSILIDMKGVTIVGLPLIQLNPMAPPVITPPVAPLLDPPEDP